MNSKLIGPKLIVNPLKSDDPRAMEAYHQMLSDPRWINATSFRSQCEVLIEYLHDPPICMSFSQLGYMFGSRHCVQKQYYKIQKQDLLKPHGRPRLLSASQERELTEMINCWHSKGFFPSYDEITEFILERFHLAYHIESVRHFVTNHLSFQNGIEVPFDQNRLHCPENDIDEYYDLLENSIKDSHPSFIYNFDEVGYQEYVDSREITVVVPQNFSSEKVFMPYDRNTKRCSAIISIALDGENPKPSLILPRKTIDSEVYSILPQNSFYQFYQPNGFITTAIFLNWWDNIFMPHLRLKKEKYNYSGKTIVICDGLRAHHAVLDVVIKEEDNIQIIYLPPHSSDQTQALDLGVFGFQKRVSRFRVQPPQNFSPQSQNIIKVISAAYRSTDPFSTASAFRQSGIVLEYTKDHTQNVKVLRGCARSVRHYSPERLENEENKTEAQIKAEKTRLTWDEVHKNSFRISIE